MSKIIESSPTPVAVASKPDSVPNVGFTRDSISDDIKGFFGVDAGLPDDVRSRLETIVDVASYDAKSKADVMLKVKEMQRKIGAAYYGAEAINRIFNYAKLMKNRIEIEKMIKAYEVEE